MAGNSMLEELLDQAAQCVRPGKGGYPNARAAAEDVSANTSGEIAVDDAEVAILVRLRNLGRSEAGLPLTPMTGYGHDAIPDHTGWA